ncbi:MAG: hypothetical protein K2H29_11885 [Oscillospiraceae bacterium]|nr:hypothetical protein [Oscillospiraceae bacterium]MDE5885760.1 hypothetical protein [Oscillospiraceae bacterium]
MKIQKNTAISESEISESELAVINTMAMTELKAEDIFTFKAILCDNQVDRDFEAFSETALHQLANLFVGKPVIKDHQPSSDNQIARIYRTEVTQGRLIAYCYMMRTARNADLIKEIQGGIKKEGSVGCAINARKCSICRADLTKSHCRHIPGKTYRGQLCYSVLSDAQDAYEFSLVAVPAQRNAGISKNFDTEQQKADEIRIRSRIAGLYVKIGGNSNDD